MMKCAILGHNASNLLPSNSLSPVTLVKDWKFGRWQVFGLWGRKVHFEELLTIRSKNRVISSLKTAQNLNSKVRNPQEIVNLITK